MAEHQRDTCPQRSTDVKLESFIKRMEERYEREMVALKSEVAEQKKEMATVREKMQIMKV